VLRAYTVPGAVTVEPRIENFEDASPTTLAEGHEFRLSCVAVQRVVTPESE
jgi:hypothetical protein